MVFNIIKINAGVDQQPFFNKSYLLSCFRKICTPTNSLSYHIFFIFPTSNSHLPDCMLSASELFFHSLQDKRHANVAVFHSTAHFMLYNAIWWAEGTIVTERFLWHCVSSAIFFYLQGLKMLLFMELLMLEKTLSVQPLIWVSQV